jgi:hypothetical protein
MLLSNRATEEGNDDSSDNCVACRRKLAARRKRAIP